MLCKHEVIGSNPIISIILLRMVIFVNFLKNSLCLTACGSALRRPFWLNPCDYQNFTIFSRKSDNKKYLMLIARLVELVDTSDLKSDSI